MFFPPPKGAQRSLAIDCDYEQTVFHYQLRGGPNCFPHSPSVVQDSPRIDNVKKSTRLRSQIKDRLRVRAPIMVRRRGKQLGGGLRRIWVDIGCEDSFSAEA